MIKRENRGRYCRLYSSRPFTSKHQKQFLLLLLTTGRRQKKKRKKKKYILRIHEQKKKKKLKRDNYISLPADNRKHNSTQNGMQPHDTAVLKKKKTIIIAPRMTRFLFSAYSTFFLFFHGYLDMTTSCTSLVPPGRHAGHKPSWHMRGKNAATRRAVAAALAPRPLSTCKNGKKKSHGNVGRDWRGGGRGRGYTQSHSSLNRTYTTKINKKINK